MCDEISCRANYDHLPPMVVPDEQRRAFMKGALSLPLAAILLDPALARAAAASGGRV